MSVERPPGVPMSKLLTVSPCAVLGHLKRREIRMVYCVKHVITTGGLSMVVLKSLVSVFLHLGVLLNYLSLCAD